MHPYYRYTHVTYVVVGFSFDTHPWQSTWAPPARPGWAWVPGYWAWGWWSPGYWRPIATAPVYAGRRYVYVAGWWSGDVYIEGHYRSTRRVGWVWVDGHYTAEGAYIAGHWRPAGASPKGYVWEPGFFDGETWVEGFWRPKALAGFRWISPSYDADGLYVCGYWEPVQPNPGHIWVPGWFDGEIWQAGEWVAEATYRAEDLDEWSPEGDWEEPVESKEISSVDGEAPLALPVKVAE